jgi:hypothetical protein
MTEQQTPASVVERLREIAGWFSEGVAVDHFMAQSVAAEHAADLRAILAHVERLSAERDGLREALRPFALAADNMDGDEPDTLFIYDSPESAMIDYADLRRARAALTQGESRQTGANGEVLKVACDHCQRMTRVPTASIAITAAREATYSGPFDLEWLRAGLSKRDIEVSEGYSPAVAALVALDHYRGALEGNPLADPSCLAALPAAPTPAGGGGE